MPKLSIVRPGVAMLLPLLAILSCPQLAQAQIDKSTPGLGRFDTEILSMDLMGNATVPFGPNGEEVDVLVRATRATDHNSSRSNKTSHTPISAGSGGGSGDLGDFAGRTLELSSTLDLKFDLSFEDVDPNVDFDPTLGTNLIEGSLETSAILDAPLDTFLFDTDLPDYGMLAGRGVEHRGHVTVLKISHGGGGGGGGRIFLVANGISLGFDQGGGIFTPQANGDVLHEANATMGVSALFDNRAFEISGLTGTIAEMGRFSIQAVPEPTSLVLLVGCALAGLSGRRQAG